MEVIGILWTQTHEILSYNEKYSIYLFHQEKIKHSRYNNIVDYS